MSANCSISPSFIAFYLNYSEVERYTFYCSKTSLLNFYVV